MASIVPTGVRRRLRFAVAGAVAFTMLTAAAAAASAPSLQEARGPLPGFLLDRGRYTSFEAADPGVQHFPFGINDRGQIVGSYENPDAAPSPRPAAMRLARTA